MVALREVRQPLRRLSRLGDRVSREMGETLDKPIGMDVWAFERLLPMTAEAGGRSPESDANVAGLSPSANVR